MDSPKNIARLNVEHYRRLLATETDPSKQAMIEKLLAEEEAKPRTLEGERKSEDSGWRGWSHSRQCEGSTSIRRFVAASIQPPRMRRHGKTSACAPS
jgi:hypothetical protein